MNHTVFVTHAFWALGRNVAGVSLHLTDSWLSCLAVGCRTFAPANLRGHLQHGDTAIGSWLGFLNACSLLVPLCTVLLLEVPLEVAGHNIVASYFWIGRADATRQTPERGLGSLELAVSACWSSTHVHWHTVVKYALLGFVFSPLV